MLGFYILVGGLALGGSYHQYPRCPLRPQSSPDQVKGSQQVCQGQRVEEAARGAKNLALPSSPLSKPTPRSARFPTR